MNGSIACKTLFVLVLGAAAVPCLSAQVPAESIGVGVTLDSGMNLGIGVKLPSSGTYIDVSYNLPASGGALDVRIYSYALNLYVLKFWSIDLSPIGDFAYAPVPPFANLNYVTLLAGLRIGTSLWVFDRIEIGASASILMGIALGGLSGTFEGHTYLATPAAVFVRYYFGG